MKTRKTVLCKVTAHGEIGPLYTPGESTVFGLVITPDLTPHGFDVDYGYAITEPVTGLRVAAGWTKFEAMQNLRHKCREQRAIHGSFVAALDYSRRYARSEQIAEIASVKGGAA